MGNESKNSLGAILLENGSSLAESAASVGHVVDKDGDLVLDVTDKNLLLHSQLSHRITKPIRVFLPCDQQRWGGDAPCG